MVFNATFINISAISWKSDLLVEDTGVPTENQRPVASNWQISFCPFSFVLFVDLQTPLGIFNSLLCTFAIMLLIGPNDL